MYKSLMIAAFDPIAQALTSLRVRWYVGGSVASSIHGVSRTTLDVDVVAELTLDHVKPLMATLQSDYYVSEVAISDSIRRRSSFNAIHLPTSFKVDVFAVKDRLFDQSSIGRIETGVIQELGESLPVIVASVEDTILSKLEWYRKGNEISERQWLDILGICRIKRDKLDLAYLSKWAEALNVQDLLDRALLESRPLSS